MFSIAHGSGCILSIALMFLTGCIFSDSSIYVVQEVSVELGNIMYTDGEDRMYDVWCDGVKLNNGDSTIFRSIRDYRG